MPADVVADAVTMSWKRLTDKVKETSRADLCRETARLATWEDEGGTTSSRLPVPLRKS